MAYGIINRIHDFNLNISMEIWSEFENCISVLQSFQGISNISIFAKANTKVKSYLYQRYQRLRLVNTVKVISQTFTLILKQYFKQICDFQKDIF